MSRRGAWTSGRAASIDAINRTIRLRNELGLAAIVAVTGANGTGKTTIANWLLADLDFDQVFNLSAVTKTIQVVRPDLAMTSLENLERGDDDHIYDQVLTWAVERYVDDGVNAVIDGVQVSPPVLAPLDGFVGGVILHGAPDLPRGDRRRHFRRVAKVRPADLRSYEPAAGFASMPDCADLEMTYDAALAALARCCARKEPRPQEALRP